MSTLRVISAESVSPEGEVTYWCGHTRDIRDGIVLCVRAQGHRGRHRYYDSPSYVAAQAMRAARNRIACLIFGHRWLAYRIDETWHSFCDGDDHRASLVCSRCHVREQRATLVGFAREPAKGAG